jgi:hypothetical protein
MNEPFPPVAASTEAAAEDLAPTEAATADPAPTEAAEVAAPTETTDKPWVAAWMREQAEHEARRAAREVSPRRRRRVTGPSVVLSIRLDPTELAALEGRAALLGLKPTVLARNLIRTGLASRGGEALLGTVERLDALVEELRGLVG